MKTKPLQSVEEVVQPKVNEFWANYDTERAELLGLPTYPDEPRKTRVTRGLERISKDVVDDFHVSLKHTLTQDRNTTHERAVEIVKKHTPTHNTREYRDTDQMGDKILNDLNTLFGKGEDNQ